MPSHPNAVSPTDLRTRIATEALPFTSTDELEPLEGILGQKRAQEAIDLGIELDRPGYNLYVMGDPGTGRLSLVTQLLRRKAPERAAPMDWLYLNHFEKPREPVAVSLPAGLGHDFLAEMETFVDNLLATFPAAFDNPAYQRRRTLIDREFAVRFDHAVEQVEKIAERYEILVFRDGDNISFAPQVNGTALDEAAFANLPEERREQFHRQIRELEDCLREALLELPQWKREANEALRRLNSETIDQAVSPLLARLKQRYSHFPQISAYLDAARANLDRTVAEYLLDERAEDARTEANRRTLLLDRYAPRLLVTNDPHQGAPVLFVANPSYPNLFGRIEYTLEQGLPHTHFRLIYPGALHQANGGYLVLEAEQIVSDPQAWPALKRALKTRQIRIEPPAGDSGNPAVMTLNPEPIPLNLKVILVGSRELYYLLETSDPEFKELFRLPVDFDDYFPLTSDSILAFARLIKTQILREGFGAVSAAGLARLIEYGARLAEHQHRLSARIGDLCEILAEADLLRRRDGAMRIEATHVDRTLAAREHRVDRLNQELLKDMLDGVLLIATEGEAVGRVNGLTVLEVGETCFAIPARITATAFPGERGVVDIEREAELGQSIHSKGVLILSGYLGFRYARDFALALSAHLAIEQSYGYIDGDSAALAEVCALLSALTRVPIQQSLAVTGSINQYGDVQAVGGVNEKVEGFFRLCQARGLNGRQGVVIPFANIRNLMLKDEVVAAVRAGQFTVYAVRTVDEALQLLTGKAARTVNRMAVHRLREFARLAERKD